MNRREFLDTVGGGLVIAVLAPEIDAQESGRRPGRVQRDQWPQSLAAWIHIAQDGAVTVYTGKVEMGQNIRTSLAQVVAEELRLPVESIRMVMGDTALCPYDPGTFGSLTTRTMSPQLRKAGATARRALASLASERWKVPADSLTMAGGRVTNPASGAALSFGELTTGKQFVETVSDDGVTPAAQWKVAGQSVPKVTGPDIVTGRHRYPSDLTRPGMLHGKVLRAPSFGATLVSADMAKAAAIPGAVVIREGDFCGVAAKDVDAAEQVIEAIHAEWKTTPQPAGKDLYRLLRPGEPPAKPQGDIALVQTYTVAYIAHTPLEPRAAVAEWDNGKLTVWTGTQRPFGVHDELAAAFKLAADQVHVMMPDTGSGYGGKHTGECAVEAARLAKAAGKPVRVIWTREEEFTWAYFRPAGVIDVASSTRADGRIVSWEFHNYNSGPAGLAVLYDVPGAKTQFHQASAPLRQGSYRALAATANHFAREVHIDEIAHTAKMDPVEFRLKNVKDERLRGVLEAAVGKFGWKKAPAGRSYGVAIGSEKGSFVATCVEMEGTRVVRVVTAFDCGPVVNPAHLRNQIEGAIVMGLGGALFEEVEFDNGRILNATLAAYRVPRFTDVPKLETVLIDRKDVPTVGAGETPIVAIAPAIAAALYDGTGVRHRALPMRPGK